MTARRQSSPSQAEGGVGLSSKCIPGTERGKRLRTGGDRFGLGQGSARARLHPRYADNVDSLRLKKVGLKGFGLNLNGF